MHVGRLLEGKEARDTLAQEWCVRQGERMRRADVLLQLPSTVRSRFAHASDRSHCIVVTVQKEDRHLSRVQAFEIREGAMFHDAMHE